MNGVNVNFVSFNNDSIKNVGLLKEELRMKHFLVEQVLLRLHYIYLKRKNKR